MRGGGNAGCGEGTNAILACLRSHWERPKDGKHGMINDRVSNRIGGGGTASRRQVLLYRILDSLLPFEPKRPTVKCYSEPFPILQDLRSSEVSGSRKERLFHLFK